MIQQRFDLISTVHEQIETFIQIMRMKPHALMLSRAAFSWLIAIYQEEMTCYGVCPVDFEKWTYNTGRYTVRIMIDEMADDYAVKVI